MTPSRILKLLGLLIVLAPCAGCCCHPKKGITLRGGLDFRECKKPSGFVELVETGWDERRRVQDLRWLENTDYAESTTPSVPTSSSPTKPAQSYSQPTTTIPKVNQPPQSGVPPMPEELPPPPPVSTPPVPAPEPEAEPKLSPQLNEQFEMDLEFDESVSLPADYSDEEDYQRMIELSGYERPVRSVSNRPTQAQPSPRQPAASRSGGWLWSKP
ncbi:hypothetical protein CA54_26460 [Symmachiella macrocystis]|uniref:Filamentous hemagglutinin n=1 Tax=Symmachiella macrocystis TaxID=2527985 RepID=A0A5C6BQY1_9PLAN|nr:hypothetical protein [Symmachiella macrocystis]TWU13811.1 hypothetical protein CA54_26460 [Symmachiella macrocystis]